jgi:hypothetical protein
MVPKAEAKAAAEKLKTEVDALYTQAQVQSSSREVY